MPTRRPRHDLRHRLAVAVRRLRGARGWTQEAAAEAAHLNPRHFQKIEMGSVNLTIRTLERLCGAFGVDVHELFA